MHLVDKAQGEQRQWSDRRARRPADVARDRGFDATRNLLEFAWKGGKRSFFPCRTASKRTLEGGRDVHAESFTAMVIADLLFGQRGYSTLVRSIGSALEHELGDDHVFHFFKEHERLPPDADCTALGMSVLIRTGARIQARANRALDQIIANSTEDGVVETYFDPTGERSGIVDSVVCVNVLYMAFQLGRAHELTGTLDHVYRVLTDGTFTEGTRYYHSPDSFLYFLGRVVHEFAGKYPELLRRFVEPLKQAVAARQGTTTYTLDLAQRVLLSAWLEIEDGGERAVLETLQDESGGWPGDALFRYGRKEIYFGSRVMTSALATTALVMGMRGNRQRVSFERRDEDEIETAKIRVVGG